MFQTAIFVDAGYLYAQGSALIAGAKAKREAVRLNVPAMLADLLEESRRAEPNARLLRIYWYDGLARGGVLNLEQRSVATSENVKCRFGTINGRGEQKGVDSLIVTDLIELARGQAISDALIMSGDEDIRVGVQLAQTYGIRVHLLGIQPARGSQSPDLIAEADTLTEWGRDTVAKWLSVVPMEDDRGHVETTGDWLSLTIERRLDGLSPEDAGAIYAYAQQNRMQLPADFDRPALAQAGSAAGRELSPTERRAFRAQMLEALRTRSGE